MHEEGHRIINQNYGIDSTIIMSNFGLSGQTVPHTTCKDTRTCENLLLAQSNHESIGYTFLPMFFILLFIICIIINIIGVALIGEVR